MTSGSFIKRGGPHKIRKVGADRYEFSIGMPQDEHGRLARECPNEHCSPAFFRVKPGTGIVTEQMWAFCPYCRHKAGPDGFWTKEQLRYATSIMEREAHAGMERMVQEALGLGPSGRKKYNGGLFSLEMKYKTGKLPLLRRPVEDELQRDIVCPECGLDHAVFGLAIWCPGCGADVFPTHIEAELAVVFKMLGDVERRGQELGARVAARDLENCLEDVVSIFEAVLKVLIGRHIDSLGWSEEKRKAFWKKVGNAFQNIERAERLLLKDFALNLGAGSGSGLLSSLQAVFQKRHPITHNLGIIDRKYLEQTLAAGREGTEIRVSEEEVRAAADGAKSVLAGLQGRLFPVPKEPK